MGNGYGPLHQDSWYERRGLTPPEHIVHHGSDTPPLDPHIHKWRHKGGPWLHCDEGQNGHGIPYDHINTRLVGTTAEGAPILRPIVLSTKIPPIQFIDC